MELVHHAVSMTCAHLSHPSRLSNNGGTRRPPDIRSRALLVSKVWASVCQSAPPRAPQTSRQMAPREGLPHHSWRTSLSLAGCGSRRPRARYSRATSAEQESCQEVFSQVAQGLADVPQVIITDKLTGYGAAKREVLRGVKHQQSRCLNNCAENSHQPTRQRERRIQRFKSPDYAQTLPIHLRARRLALLPQTSPAPCPGLPPGHEATIPGVAKDYQFTNGC
jgi:DDE domain